MKTTLSITVLVALLSGDAFAASDATPTFNRDVAPIFFEHCVSCHQPGQIAPMSLLSYTEARPWAKSIRNAVANRIMPPWHADSSKVSYANDRSLAPEEIDTIVRWVASGALEGAPEDLPPRPPLADGWRLGEPDLVFEVKEGFVIPAEAEEIPYQSLTFAIDLAEDLYVRAWEILPSQLGAVHHANLVRSPVDLDGQSVGIAKAVMQGGDYIGSYLPGHSYVVYPEGMAHRLPAGSHLGIQVHYVSVGEEVEDRIRFGVHLAEGRVDKLVRVMGTDYRDLDIPPHEPAYAVVDEVTALYDVYALSSGIHMHLRGSAYTMEAVLPDGTTRLITEVPSYDFNWQSNYVLEQPVLMPEGTKLRVTSVWDNSAANPYNPDPSARVRYGPWTDDEMVNAWAHVYLADEKLGLRIEHGRVVGGFADAVETPHPFLIQTLPAADSFQRNRQGH
jgi:mono/diheme cytochrome c family protein